MTPERYRQIGELYHAALEVASAERPAFLTRECAGDEDLRHEVESLINSHQQSEDFIAKPALSVAAEMLAARAPESITGQMIGRYRVLSLVAEGGMGRVFLAEDTTLNRRVALKLLPEYFTNDKNQLQRFHQEARATSALNHPNILTVYEVGHWHGSDFIATEFVEGVTLRKRMRRKLSVAAAVDIAQQVASALSAAHAAGIVHRDIKPENIMIRPDGLVRILDFGIAKYAEPKRTRHSKDSWVKTATGVIVGTTAYMSPEQARGEVIDGRTDIWSLGVILYEMIAHRLPFRGKTPTDRVAAILEREPEPLNKIRRGIPHELEAIIKRALAKDKENRYTRAADLAEDLRELRRAVGEERTFRFGLPLPARGMMSSRKRRSVSVGANPYVPLRRRAYLFAVFAVVLFVGAIALSYYSYTQKNTTVGDKKSIAVLPLKPINTTDRDELYEIGIADSLIHRLSSIKGFVVRPLSATRKYADIEQDPIAAGREQQVDYILASNYQLAGGKIRVTSQLYNVASGQVEETYKSEKDAGNIFAMQDAVAGEVGDLLLARFETSSSSPIAKRGTSNEEAYRLYLQGMFLVDKENLADNKRAIELFDEALAIDPNYAKAWAGKARALCYFAHWGGSSPDAQFAKAKPAIERALALDANLPEAYGVLGIIKADYDWNFSDSEKQFLRAIEIAPNSDTLHRWYAMRLAGKGRS
ncbi:MAG TPA: protein kinase, partial [Candidatus Binatia bacterium]|nr:protein kinase [Candidatus Binatia bacterium]